MNKYRNSYPGSPQNRVGQENDPRYRNTFGGNQQDDTFIPWDQDPYYYNENRNMRSYQDQYYRCPWSGMSPRYDPEPQYPQGQMMPYYVWCCPYPPEQPCHHQFPRKHDDDKCDKDDRHDKCDKDDRHDRHDKCDKDDRHDRHDKCDKCDKDDRHDKCDKDDRRDKCDKDNRHDKCDRDDKCDKNEREERGAIIPYASGPARALTINVGSQQSNGVAVAFGSSVPGIPLTGGMINVNTIDNMAFSMPRDGVITSIAAFFSVSTPVTLVTPITIHAQLFASDTPDNNFSPLGSPVTLMPPFNGLVMLGSVASAVDTSQRLNVKAGTRLLLVFSAMSQAAIAMTTTITGFFSGGLEIR